MKLLKIIFLLATIAIFASCEKIFMDPKPQTDALSIFDEYATLVKEKYAMLDFKGVDIDILADSIRSTISGDISDNDLFNKLAIITTRLRDGHSSLSQDNTDITGTALHAGFDLLAGYPPGVDFFALFGEYVNPDTNPNIKFLGDSINFTAIYGTLLQNTEIGYAWIPSWDVEISDEEIEQIFEEVKDTKGLIIDMRGNGGGDPALATKFAAYFTDQAVDTGFERFKTGPGENDFSDSRVILQPAASNNKYLKEVRVLTDRNVYSASTTFLYSVDPVETIKTMGQRSGGGSGSVADGYLANGWHWSLSTSEFIDAKGRHLDDGVEPDIAVALDTTTMIDEIIEAAILDLQ